MPIQEVHMRGKANIVTFTTHDLQFSSSLVAEKGLDKYEYARLGVDDELHRIYIGFEKKQAPGLGKFYTQSGRSSRKMIAIGQLYSNFDWIKVLKGKKDKAERQFELKEVNRKDTDTYKMYQYYIEIKPTKK
jgi:hypothetical protein